jgi:hypothetical protein
MSISALQSSATQRRSTWCALSKAFAFVALLLLNSVIYAAGICPVSKPVGLFGIGDGCTLGYNNIPIAPPNFFVFESTFTPSCDRHDACYTSLGGTYGLCDGNFLSDMRSACRSRFSPWFPIELAACTAVAQDYYNAMVAARPVNELPNGQRDALVRLRNLRVTLDANPVQNKCATTAAEQSNLFTPQLIATINGLFANNVGRSPTVFEYISAAEAGSAPDPDATPLIYTDYAAWQALANSYALSRSAFPAAPNVSYSVNSVNDASFTLSNPSPTTAYTWVINGVVGIGPGISLPLPQPTMYNRTYQFTGFVYGVNSSGANRNIAAIKTSVVVPGWCRPNPGGPCV